jgi:cation transport ATPase
MNTMQHQTYLHYSFCKPLLLALALFLSSPSFLNAAPPIDLLDKREVVIEKMDRKAAKAAKKRWKKEIRKKINKQKVRKKRIRSKAVKIVLTLLVVLITLAAASALVVLGVVYLEFGGMDFVGLPLLFSVLALPIILFGAWLIFVIHGRKWPRFMRGVGLFILTLITIGLAVLLFKSGLGASAPVWRIILGGLGAGILALGAWLFISILRKELPTRKTERQEASHL